MKKGETRKRVVQLVLDSVKGQYTFSDQPDLDGMVITGIETLSATDSPFYTDGSAVVPQNALNDIYITMRNRSNVDVIYQQPVFQYQLSANQGRVRPLWLKELAWNKCELNLSRTTNITAGQSFLLVVHYQPCK